MDPNEETSEEEDCVIEPEISEEVEFSDVSEEEPSDEVADTDDADHTRRARIGRFARRLIDRKEIASDTRELLGSVLATSDKAKTEAIRMAAKEVRSYLEAMELKEDVKALLTSYSLEISISLKPLAGALTGVGDTPPDSDSDSDSDSEPEPEPESE